MGLGGISVWQLLIILAIILLLFGTKRLKNIGSDLGGAIRGFKKAMTEKSEIGKPKEEEIGSITENHSSHDSRNREK